MIYSASRRTDMTAFHPDELAGRVRRSRRLEAIVLWTKDPRNLVRHAELAAALAPVPKVVQLTVTGLAGTAWEPGVPPPEAFREELRDIAAALPRGAVRWRFDPVFPGPDLLGRFRRARDTLESALGGLDEVTISFPDPYAKAVARAAAAGLAWPKPGAAQKADIVSALAAEFPFSSTDADNALSVSENGDAGAANRRPINLCCEPDLLALPGVRRASCIDGSLFRRLYGLPLDALPKDSGQRAACGCVASTDIGSYDMACGHGCRYCYATR